MDRLPFQRTQDLADDSAAYARRRLMTAERSAAGSGKAHQNPLEIGRDGRQQIHLHQRVSLRRESTWRSSTSVLGEGHRQLAALRSNFLVLAMIDIVTKLSAKIVNVRKR